MHNDYLIHYNHNHDRLGRFASSIGGAGSSVGGKVVKKKKTVAPKADIKSGKSANTKLSQNDRNRLVNSGSAKEINAKKSQLSNRELESAINRLREENVNRSNLEKQLSDLANPKSQSKINKAINWMDDHQKQIKTINDFATESIKLYNNYASINNAFNSSSKMPIIEGQKKKKKLKKPE